MNVPRQRILVVDDEQNVRTSMRRFLEDGGFEVGEANDGQEALEILRRGGTDLVVLDLRMPRLSGIDTLRQIRTDWPDLPVVVVSGAGTMQDVVQALRLGAWDYLTKPIEDLDILRHAVTRAMERSRLIEEHRHYQQHLEQEVERRTAELISANAENAKLQEQFHQAQKMESVGRLAGGVAHDLNNLLSIILGYGELLLGTFSPGDPRRESVEQVFHAGERGRDLVRQLLAFSRKQVMEFKFLDLNTAVKDFEKLLRRAIREDVVIDFIPAPSLPSITGDIGQLEQVIMNLSVNAQDAMPAGGKLTIETGVADLDGTYVVVHPEVAPGQYVMLAVSDTGHGMNAATQARIFEPFFTTKPLGKGTGLGLATTYGIVKQHGGNIWVYSEPDKGTTFKIYLPIAQTASGPAQVRQAAGAAELRGSQTVLLAEDDDMVRGVARAVLQSLGYTVLLGKNGTEALSVLEEYAGPVHLLLTDVVMPDMNGRQLFARISEKSPNMKVLFMSGYTANVIAHGGILDTGVDFIQKPFSIHGLAAKIRKVLDG